MMLAGTFIKISRQEGGSLEESEDEDAGPRLDMEIA